MFLHKGENVGNKAKRLISKRVFQENKARQIFRKANISSFFEKIGVLCFLETSVLRFALLPYYRQKLILTKPMSG